MKNIRWNSVLGVLFGFSVAFFVVSSIQNEYNWKLFTALIMGGIAGPVIKGLLFNKNKS